MSRHKEELGATFSARLSTTQDNALRAEHERTHEPISYILRRWLRDGVTFAEPKARKKAPTKKAVKRKRAR